MWRQVTLERVERLDAGVGVVVLARRLIDGDIDAPEALEVLETLGVVCSGQPALFVLSEALGHIVTCFADMRALRAEGIDIAAVRRFFMGVMRWPPQVVRRARLCDLRDAFDGYCAHHGMGAAQGGVDKAFLTEMLRRFPDVPQERME